MADLPEALRTALAARLAGLPTDTLRVSVDRLIEAYRSGAAPRSPILATAVDVAAYAAYRMPATFSAVRAALAAANLDAPPERHLDLGGGTGAAAWAAVDVFPDIREITVVDQVSSALDFGSRLAADSTSAALRAASWRSARFETEDALPAADLVTVSYVLGELVASDQRRLVEQAAGAGGVVAVIEPGTPAGYERILAARTCLLELGRTIVAPCPHQAPCPIPAGRDWCHFGARVNRSALHRRVKDADLSYEDEKFSYVVAAPASNTADLGGRVLRRPVQRKGLVQLRLCMPDGRLADRIVTKRHGADYKLARDTSWGDTFPSGPDVPAGPS
jgi:ribosomal protein RSM22 (predicted rRNA methylase)